MPYHLFTQSAQEVMRPENSPATNMSEFLVRTGQGHLATVVSVYSQRGDSAQQLRRFFMNDEALALWNSMGHQPVVLETTRRPANKAELCFGVPFSE